MQQEKISRAERNWTNPLNALQEAIHYSFIKFCICCFPPLVRILCVLLLESLKMLSTWSSCGTFGISVPSPERMSHQPIQNSVALFRSRRQNTSHNDFVKKIVCIDHRDNLLARCDLIFLLLRCQGAWNKTCTQLSLFQILFQNPNNYGFGDVQKFCYHS